MYTCKTTRYREYNRNSNCEHFPCVSNLYHDFRNTPQEAIGRAWIKPHEQLEHHGHHCIATLTTIVQMPKLHSRYLSSDRLKLCKGFFFGCQNATTCAVSERDAPCMGT